MKKIATPQDLRTELLRVISYCQEPNPSREKLASELRVLAGKLTLGGLVPIEQLLDEDPEIIQAMGYRWTNQRSRIYNKGDEIFTLDETGYHDSVVHVESDTIIEDDNGTKYLAVSQKGVRGVMPEELDHRGYMLGDVNRGKPKRASELADKLAEGPRRAHQASAPQEETSQELGELVSRLADMVKDFRRTPERLYKGREVSVRLKVLLSKFVELDSRWRHLI